MPYKMRKLPGKNRFRVSSPHGVKARSTTKTKAEKQIRLLTGVKHGMVPR